MKVLSLVLFVLSGCAGLIYQAIWSHYLGLYLGHAAYAQSLVLAIFMGGMALGAWGVSRFGTTWRNLLLAYAVIELVIGLAAAVFHPVFNGVVGFALDTALPAMPTGWGVGAFKWISGTLLILPQAILLGMTFPLMSNAVMRRNPGSDGAVLSGLYFANSIGAAAGALFATFVLLPVVGLPGAMQIGAIVNVLVALIAYIASRSGEPAPREPQQASSSAAPLPLQGLLCWAAAITGATSFVYEIGWVRMLAMVLGSTVHAFELMLAAFIGGLAFGGLWVRSRIDGFRSLLRAGGVVQILMGLAALASLVIYDRSFDWVAWMLQALDRTEQGYVLYNAASATVAVLVMAPAAFFAGMTLPIFTLALLRGGGESAVGRIYAANTIGAIVGVFLAIHLLIPVIGLKLAMIGAAVGDLVLGVVLLRRDRSPQRGNDSLYLGSVVACGLAVAATLVFARFDPVTMTSGVYRTGSARRDNVDWEVLYYRDGKTASIGVVQSNASGTRSIVTNGKPDAAINTTGSPSPDESTMTLLGVLPLMLHRSPADIATIGFGSGMSTHAALGDARVKRVDTIEIEPAMVEGARAFLPRNARAYDDPRSFMHYEDAKTFFASNRSQYDVIVSEPSNPWVAGVATLFSREFYELVPRYLKPDGILVQWIQLYEIDEALLATIMNALGDSFDDYEAYQSGSGDLIVVASRGKVAPLGEPAAAGTPLGDELARLDLRTRTDFALRKLGDKATLAPYYAALSGRRNSDYYPVVSLEAPRTRFRSVSATYTDSLPVQDVALLEVLSGEPRPYEQLSLSRGLPLSMLAGQAQGLAQFLETGKYAPSILDADDGSAVMMLRQTFNGCGGDLPESIVIAALSRVAGTTTPFLSPEASARLWNDRAWAKCPGESKPVARMFELLGAEAQRDWRRVHTIALDMLEHQRESMQPFVADRTLRLACLAAIATGDYKDVAEILERFGKSVAPVGADGERRRTHLRAYAAARAGAAVRNPQ
jgi:spermidine synthase